MGFNILWIPVFAIFVMSVVIHEVAHGYVAYRLGDETAFVRGRLTLNPIKHIDPIWTIVMPIFFIHTMGFAFGGAKPVPINPSRFKNMRRGFMWTAIAGPGSNVLIALCLAAVLAMTKAIRIYGGVGSIYTEPVLGINIIFNLYLAMFNMIPIPPLDGSRVLAGIVSRAIAQKIYALERYGIFIIVFILWFPGTQFIFGYMGYAVYAVAYYVLGVDIYEIRKFF